ANGGEKNPVKWDWSNANYTVGYSSSGNTVYGGVGWNNDFSAAGGFSFGADAPSMGYLNNGTPHMGPLKSVSTPGEIGVQKANEAWDAVNSAVGYVGTAVNAYGDYRYAPERLWSSGHFRTSTGKYYSLDVLKVQENGKYVKGVQGLRIGAKVAEDAIRWTKGFGVFTTGFTVFYSGYKFYKDQSFMNGLDLGMSVAGAACWQLGAAYEGGKVTLKMMRTAYSTLPDQYLHQGYYQSLWLNQYYPSHIGW
ncbi:MAG: hypothetical protein PUB21_06895, partial [Bacteroidales bacterium]|nr:hypothetical protein [Bacteroidales bacterium]